MKLSDFIEKYGNYEIKDIDKMKDLVVTAERFKPTNGESYYCVLFNNNIGVRKWNGDNSDDFYYSLNRIYRTREECIRYIEIHKKFKEASYTPNWSCDENSAVTIAYSHESEHLYFYYAFGVEFPNLYYFSSLEEISKLINEFGVADIKKYILGIYNEEDV